MFVYLLEFVYAFLVLWIIPYYPRYRSFIHGRKIQIPACMVCAAALISVIVLVSYEKRDTLILLFPLLIAVSYVDWRDQEIPDLPVALMLFFGLARNHDSFPLAAFLAVIICLPFVIQGKLGMGDAKLMGVMVMVNQTAAAAGFAAASLLCLAHHQFKKESSLTKIPFAPYLCTGFLTMLFFLH